jgi:hypothetical protein
MDEYYHPLYERVTDLHNKYHDTLSDRTHPMAAVLDHEMRNLRTDIQESKNPRTIEDRVKVIQHQLLEMKVQGTQLMNHDHIDYLHHGYEQVRQNVRQFPHY